MAAVVLRRPDGDVLTVRKRGTSRFMLPGGKPEPGESPAETAVREAAEEVGIALDLERMELLGRFEAPAANEPDHLLVSTVYTHPLESTPRVAGEIAELRWQSPTDLRDDLAPMLVQNVFPALRISAERADSR
ncbi:MAG: NUDIX domain-containing protein [Propionibacterium sp.]|nr:NUDIX domain-containing protein [Propionibacterium sp.]